MSLCRRGRVFQFRFCPPESALTRVFASIDRPYLEQRHDGYESEAMRDRLTSVVISWSYYHLAMTFHSSCCLEFYFCVT